jgi:hypothetical protein
VLAALEHAILGQTPEYEVAAEVDGTVTGITVFGFVAGTVGAARILYVAGGSSSLVKWALAQLSARLVVAELPDDRPFDRMWKLLLECGFQEESVIADFYRPGVGARLLRHAIDESQNSQVSPTV